MNVYKISVILPSFNVKKYIGECLASVCGQTLRDIEIICVDAGSTDGTVQEIEKFASLDSRIELINSTKKSYGYQVNIGIQRAKGKYIAILETDDYIDSEMYEVLFKIAEETECDYVKSNYRRYFTLSWGDRVFVPSDTLAFCRGLYDTVLRVSEHMELIRYDTNVWSGIYRRDFLVNNSIMCNESSGAAFQDIGFLQYVFWKAKTAYYTERAFYNYCIDRETSSSNYGNGMRFALQEYKRLLTEDGASKVQTCQLSSMYERMADVFEENIKNIVIQNKEQDNEDAINWFVSVLMQRQRDGMLEREWLRQIENNDKCWMSQLKQKIKVEREYRDKLLEDLKPSSVVIFGAGARGKNALRELDGSHIRVDAFCDNNKALWGSHVGGIKIYSLKDGTKMFSMAHYVIANKSGGYEMKKQLLEQGIPPEKIVIWK